METKLRSLARLGGKLGASAFAVYACLFLVFAEIIPGRGFAEQGVVATPTLAVSPSGELNITAEPGVFRQVTQSLEVTTTNFTGYTLTLETLGETTDLTHTLQSGQVIPTLTLAGEQTSLTPQEITDSYGWSVDAAAFFPAPEPGEVEELKTTNVANVVAETTELTFGVRIGGSRVAGTYQNQFRISAVANEANYQITYMPNAGSDTVTNMPTPLTQTGSVSGVEVYLDSTIPRRSGYDFLGWSTDDEATEPEIPRDNLTLALDPETGNQITVYAIWVENVCEAGYICYNGNGDDGTGEMPDQAASSNASVALIGTNFSRAGFGFTGWNTEPDGSGTQYGPGQTIQTGDLSLGGLKLYAKWVPTAGTLQNWTGCSAMSTGEVTALTDLRDGETYTVAKLADGNCWTTENLRLDPATALVSRASTNGPTAEFVRRAPLAESTNTLCTANDAACLNQIQYNSNNLNRSLTAEYNVNDVRSWYGYGMMYNWFTATAGNGTTETTGGNSVDGDICPAGWKIPQGGSTSAELYLWVFTAINRGARADATLRTYPNNWYWSGDYNGSAPTGRGNHGRMWTATAASASNAYRLGYGNGSDVTAATNNYNKWVAFPVRCVVKSGNAAVLGNIHYDANGGTGETSDETNVNFYTTSVKENEFTKDGRFFSEWNTAADGSGMTVLEGDLPTEAVEALELGAGDTLTLYAVWGEVFTLDYDANGGQGAPAQMTGVGTDSYTFIVSTVTPTRDEYDFLGWSEDADATEADYVGGDDFVAGEDETGSILYAVWTPQVCTVGQVCYRANGADAGTRLIITPNANTGEAILRGTDFSRAGFGFSGWNTEPDGSGSYFGANETITPDVSEAGLDVYAQWVPSAGTMQGWTGCSGMDTGDITALTDTRNGEVYTVAKLADGKCWMTENLRLDPSTTVFTVDNTNSPAEGFAEAVVGTTTAEATGCKADSSECDDQVRFDTDNINRSLTPSYYSTNNASSWYGYGVLYNWFTATAGNGTYSVTGTAEGDICPKGWRLPTGNTARPYGEIGALNTAINNGATNTNAKLREYPANFVLAGDHNEKGDSGRGSQARYWTASANATATVVRLGLDYSVNATTGVVGTNTVTFRAYNKWDLFAVRCLAKE
ncbi:InlB B-repeat-containing protein [Candidatus Saccharibacteria bacterium]|nr:InlB B-repeat-containing protein [Candidatus Saccharibacteria bacterium]